MLSDVCVGAVSRGVNRATLLLLNAVLALLWATLAYLLYAGAQSPPHAWLVPHAAVMLALCTPLWAVINWFILQTGLVEPADQEKELAALTGQAAAEEAGDDDEDLQRRLRELPPTSDLQMGFEESALGFDTSSLTVQTLRTSALISATDKDKSS